MINPPLISLCIIAGNEEVHIERCLKSFSPIADEIIVVIAKGNQVQDRTEEIAKSLGAKIFHYENKEKDYPHLDSFCSARNQAFDNATGKYLFWCDCDDVLPAQFVQPIIDLAEKGEHDVYHMLYKIPGSGKEPFRERMIRRGSGRWIFDIHELIILNQGTTHTHKPDIFVLHSPLISKAGSYDRNIRILNKSTQFTEIYHFYLHQEYWGLGQKEKAIQHGNIAISYPTLPAVERYEIQLHLAEYAENHTDKQKWLLNAFRSQPWRREALVELCRLEIGRGKILEALSYALMFDSLPEPDIRPWTHAGQWYTWAGDLLLAQCYRLAGNEKRGNEVEEDLFKRSNGIISLCHATRGRPHQCMNAKNIWLSKAYFGEKIEHIFAVDSDDKEVLAYTSGHRRVVVDPRGCNHAFNEAARMSSGKIIIAMPDDVDPPHYWDNMIVQKLKDYIDKSAVLAVSDGHRKDNLMPTPILTRKRFEEQGNQIFSPEYKTVYADNEFTHRAYKDKVVVEGREIVFTHNHPLFNKDIPMDATYLKQNAEENYTEGLEIFKRRNPEIILDTVTA